MTPTRDLLEHTFFSIASTPPVEWRIDDGLTDYQYAVEFMEARVREIHAGNASELVWLVEHPSLYTAGTSAKSKDLLDTARAPVLQSGRGGEFTYHGPGQRVVYVMLDLKRRRQDVRAFVSALEEWIIRTLSTFNVKGERREDRVGVWVVRPDKKNNFGGTPTEEKIAAIGIRLKKWISYHGLAINVDPDLSFYNGIVPCGITNYGVTSLVDLGLPISLPELDSALCASFDSIFGRMY